VIISAREEPNFKDEKPLPGNPTVTRSDAPLDTQFSIDGSRNLEQRRLENWLLACIRIEYPVIVGPNILIALASPLPDLVQVIDVNMAAAVRDHSRSPEWYAGCRLDWELEGVACRRFL
jgi:hypothetical protein